MRISPTALALCLTIVACGPPLHWSELISPQTVTLSEVTRVQLRDGRELEVWRASWSGDTLLQGFASRREVGTEPTVRIPMTQIERIATAPQPTVGGTAGGVLLAGVLLAVVFVYLFHQMGSR
jgi:hypothetical protein